MAPCTRSKFGLALNEGAHQGMVRIKLHWRLVVAIERFKNAFHYLKNTISNRSHIDKNNTITILFVCGFHGKTGGTQAICSIANLLAKTYRVKFVGHYFSHVNSLIDHGVKLTSKLDLDVDLYVCDLSIDIETLEKIRKNNGKIILSIHGFKDLSHNLSSSHIEEVLSLVDKVHFVSSIQQNSYGLDSTKYFVIPNTCRIVNRNQTNKNIGAVGNLNDKLKNVESTILIGLKSECQKIHLWTLDASASMDKRIVCHGWESDKEKIFNSFSVLVFMSQLETFGLVVIESLSAGVPCVLLNIPAFSQFSKCEAVQLVEGIEDGVVATNQFLREPEKYKSIAKKFFLDNYSEEKISEQWIQSIRECLESD